MDRLAQQLVRYRRACLLVVGVIVTLATIGATRLGFDFSFRPFFLPDASQAELIGDLAEDFRNPAGASLVAVLTGPDVLRPEMLAAIETMSEAVRALPHIERVISAATVPYVRGDGEVVSMEPLARAFGSADGIPFERGEVLANPLWQRRLISPDGRTTVVVATLERDFEGVVARAQVVDAFRDAVSTHTPSGFHAEFTGYALAEGEYARAALGGMVLAQGAATLTMAVVLYLCFGTLAGVFVPLGVVSVATIVTVGVMGFAGLALTFTTVSVPLLIVVIGVAETSFFMARFYQEQAHGGPPDDVVRRTLARVLTPCSVAAVTTALGFLSLWTGRIALTRDFGTAMAAGVLATALTATLGLPGILVMVANRATSTTSTMARRGLGLARLLPALGELVDRRRRTILGTTACVIVLSIVGMTRIRVEQYATRELPPDHPLLAAQASAERDLMGAFELQIAMRRKDGGRIIEAGSLEDLARLQHFLARQDGIIKTWSVVDYLKEVDRALRGGDTGALPQDRDVIPQYLLLLRSLGRRVDVPLLLETSDHWATIGVGIADIGAGALGRLWADIRSFADLSLAGVFDLHLLGDYWMVTRGIASVTHDFLRSIAVSFAVVFLVVAIFLRSWRLTLLSVLPNLIPIAVAAGVMGFWGIHLRVGTAIILPVSLGIAVDATVHYLARAREEAGTAADATTAAVRALRGVGRGMVFSGVALVAGFLCLLLPDLRVFHDVAILGVTALAAATAADLLVLPALFATFGWRAPVRDVRADAGVTAPASAPFGGDVVLVFTQVARATAAPEEHAATLEQSKVDAADAEAR